jgi:cysteine synthase A
MQGWAPDFIPRLTEDAVTLRLVDQVLAINGADALRRCRELAQREGIFTGITGGATLAGALRICEEAPEGANVLCMLPDTGERYLTTPLFQEVPEEMTEEEWEISRSTSACRFDAPSTTAPAEVDVEMPNVDAEAEAFVEKTVNGPSQPVVLFALEWCEFCWSVRKLFAKCEIPYRSVDLDAADYQEGNRGGRIRAALEARTGCRTIPQIFVGGEFVGGCTELFDAYRSGDLRRRLTQNDLSLDGNLNIDPYSFLPGWLQPR